MTTTPDNKLEIMLSTQLDLQIKAYGQDPTTLGSREKIQFIKDMVLAATDELHELLAETDWKPWTNAWEIRREAAAGELVDLVHFVMNIMLALGMTPDELYNKYMAKKTINAKRQEDGYDGRSTKCPGCGRALDDPAVSCRLPDADQVNLLGICIEKGAIFKTPEQIDDEGAASTPYSPSFTTYSGVGEAPSDVPINREAIDLPPLSPLYDERDFD